MTEILDYLITHVEQFRRNRLAALYSDFAHLRTTNPDGYAANTEAWRKGLADAAKEGYIPSRGPDTDLLVLHVNEDLLRSLETKEWGRPLALGTVLRDAIHRKEMVPLRDFMVAERSIYQKSWTISPLTLFVWGLKHIGLAGSSFSEDIFQTGQLVILSNVEVASKKIADRVDGQKSRVERIYSKQLFCTAFADVLAAKVTMSQTDIDILLRFMERERGMIAYDGQTIKFRSLTQADPGNITSEDSTIASLKTLMQDFETHIDTINQRIDVLSNAAQDSISRRNRVSALAALRLKRLAETNLSRLLATLEQLEKIYSKIGQAEDQVELVRILQSSTGVLKALNVETGGAERVGDVVEQLQEQMSHVEEIGNVLAEAGQTGSVNEDDIECELKKMEDEEMEEKIDDELLELEKRKLEEVLETKRKLDTPKSVPPRAVRDISEQSPENVQSLEPAITEAMARITRMSLNSGPRAETTT